MAMIKTCKAPVLQEKSASGAIASFDTILTKPLEECTSLITGYQEGSGTPSPSNVRQLHAFSSASLGKCDNNTAQLWSIDNSFNGDVEFNQLAQNGNFADATGYITQSGCTINSISDNVANVSFAGGSNAQLVHSISLTNGHKFLSMIDIKLANASDSLIFLGGSYINSKSTVATSDWQKLALMFTSTYSYWIVRNKTSNDVNNAQLRNTVVFDLTAMFGSTIADYIYNLETQTAGAGVAFFKALYPNDYYPYNAGTKQLVGDTLATFTFGQSIYQGSIDWKRGVVVGTHAKKVITDITNWEWFGGYKQAYDVNFMVDYPAGSSDVSRLKAENLKPVQPAERIDNINNFIMLVNSGGGIAISVPNGEDIASTAAWIAEHPVTFVYELATPIEIPLGGINLLTQEGRNNIFADTGDIDLTYKDLDIAKRGNFREVFKLP